MHPAKVFFIAVRYLLLGWPLFVALSIVVYVLFYKWWGDAGLHIFTALWVLPVTFRWAYLCFKSDLIEEMKYD